MPIWLLTILGSRAFWVALLVSGAGLWVLEKGIDIGRAREQAAQRRQIEAANKRIRQADQRWALKYAHDAAARDALMRETLPAIAQMAGETCDLPDAVRVQLNRIKP
jgi:hypothetical protein